MNPYGTRWRCKDKNHPTPERSHVTPGLLRLDRTGEITSDSCSAESYIPDMGTIIDSAFMKLHGTRRGFIDSSTPNMTMNMDSAFVLNELNKKQAMNSHNSPYSAPHWGCHNKTPTRPNSCAFSNFKNSTNFCSPEFKHFHHQKTGFHPAMTGHHLGQRCQNRTSHRGQHCDGHKSSRRARYSFPSERVPSDCSNWRKPTEDNILEGDKSVILDKVESTAEPPRSDITSPNLSHSKTVIENDKTPEPVINIECAMPSQTKSCEDLQLKMEKSDLSKVPATEGKELAEGSNGQKSAASVQIIDWFECGHSEESARSDVPQRIGFRVRTVSIDSESSNESSVNNKTLQREASVLSDIFQPDENVFHVTCMFKENDSLPQNKDNGTSSEVQPNEHQPCSKDGSPQTDAGVPNTQSPQSCAQKKSEPSDLDKDCARRIVLLVRNTNKKGCRPSAKKRRRSKARKEDVSEIHSSQAINTEQKTQSQKNSKEKSSSQKSGATKNSVGSTNTVAFLLGLNSDNSPVGPLQNHSFLLSFDSESDSEDSGEDFSDSDGVDELDFFSCPLQLNVFCPVKQPVATTSPKGASPTNSGEGDERQQEILDINLKWSMNFSICQQEKSKSKVTFAEGDKLCTVYDCDDEDRRGHWEEFVRDRERFQRRITEVEEIMKPVLSMERRDRIYHQYFKTEPETDYVTDDQ